MLNMSMYLKQGGNLPLVIPVALRATVSQDWHPPETKHSTPESYSVLNPSDGHQLRGKSLLSGPKKFSDSSSFSCVYMSPVWIGTEISKRHLYKTIGSASVMIWGLVVVSRRVFKGRLAFCLDYMFLQYTSQPPLITFKKKKKKKDFVMIFCVGLQFLWFIFFLSVASVKTLSDTECYDYFFPALRLK